VPAGILTDSTDGIFRCAPGDFAARLDDETRTGLGHVNKPLYPALRRAHEKGIAMYMTVQTLWGYVQMFVYDTGRDLRFPFLAKRVDQSARFPRPPT
jgi:hypothetical protein